jgi:para-nitrobenzyl esterase
MPNRFDRGRRSALLAILTLSLAACSDDNSKAGDAGTNETNNPAQPGEDAQTTQDGGSPSPVLGDDPTQVTLADGQLEGDVLGESVRFLKIPYAKPPEGPRRWKAPEKNDGWSGVRHETEFASPCPQPPSQQSPASTDEDCLYLNVWRPNDSQPGAPVMVWIHGGGFTTGSAADVVPTSTDGSLWYNGQPFAERGIVVVTINYRLGVLGFFAHSALGDEGSPVGNQGLLDQRMALRWVQDNIAAFGGDPDNVTIFGESAGAGSVCMHTVSPGSRGLFHRAVSQSGGCTTGALTTEGTEARATLDAQLAEYARQRDCEGDDVLTCLRDKPVTELVSTEMVDRTMGMDALRRNFSFGPVVDGEGGFLPKTATELFDAGEVAQVPYILGTNTDEAQLYFVAAAVPSSDEEYRSALLERYAGFAERVLAMYPIAKFEGDYRKAMARIASDSGLICSTLDTARRAVAAGLPVFMYNFNIPWSISPALLGASHASEISHVFGTPYNESAENVAVAEAMNAYWASFAETGDPNFEGAPAHWPRFMPNESDDDLRLQLDPGFETLQSFRKEECALWREYAAQQ